MDTLSNPILNSPYEVPERHFALGPNGPTGEILPGRRPSESFIPVPASKKKRGKKGGPEQESLELFDTTGERREQNSLINDIRQRVELWRGRGYPHVTPISRKLMQHWADPTREERVLFCQREAAETAIYLAEVAGRHGEPDFRTRIDSENDLHNSGLPRVAVKMATGTGKTIVMCMIIAWQVCNKAYNKRDARFTSRFLVIAPGITIRDRLRVLFPHDDGNYYDFQGLVPNDLRNLLDDAAIVITNYHTFLPKLAKEFSGVSKNTRLILTGGEDDGRFHESDEDVVDRIMRDLSSRGKGEVIVISDEAHHCYQDKPLDSGSGATKLKKDDKERNEHARVWFRGIEAVAERVGVKTVYDLSATPFYLSGSGYHEGFIFPWVVSDFSLMDAIESGIVKVPRIPVDDDVRNTDQPTYLALWQHVGDQLPKKKGKKAESDSDWVPPPVLEGALRSLYRSYEKRHEQWKEELEKHGEPPPVMIVVCPNTIVSKLVYDWISGQEIELPDGREIISPGRLPLLSNVDGGDWIDRPPTIIVDSAQLESGEALKGDFKDAAAKELEVFKSEYRARNPGADVDQLTDQDILREVLNTVGKRGKLGETIRCVVSVAMLTEGWDANTVTHILGIRAFESQLLCEQVVGRGLRRRSYVPNEEGRFEPEYAEVYGVPFAFIPTDREVQPQKPPRSPVEVFAVDDRHDLRIEFPKLDGYRVELPEAPVEFDYENTTPIVVDESLVATWTEAQGIVGEADEAELEIVKQARRQEIAFNVAAEVLTRHFPGHAGALKPWLFPELLRITKQWYDEKLTFAPGNEPGLLLLAEPKAWAAEAIYNAVVQYPDARNEVLLPLYRRFDSEGSTDDVAFLTRKAVVEAAKSPVNLVVLDGPTGNTWEETVAALLEANDAVHSYVKNDHLGFEIPYVHAGRSHQYIPDFLVRLKRQEEEDIDRTLIIEVSGGQKSPGPTTAKAETARNQWRGEQRRRLGPLGLRRDRHHGECRASHCSSDHVALRRRTNHRRAGDLKERSVTRKSASKGPTPVEAITHNVTRTNIPTADAHDLVSPEVEEMVQVVYPRELRSPMLVWKGKEELDEDDLQVDAPPLYIQEKIDPRVLIENLRKTAREGELEPELTLFETFDGLDELDLVEFYKHSANWSNRMILGDSLQVMASLAERERLRGKVQMIYIDPPYGIKFGSNWQVSARKREVKDGSVNHVSRDAEQVRAFRDTWQLGIHSYLTYLRDRTSVSRDLLTDSGSLFVQIGDENVHLVRSVLDEVMGAENFVSMISFVTTSGFTQASALPRTGDYILWYARDSDHLKSRPLWVEARERQGYRWLYFQDGTSRGLKKGEHPDDLPDQARLYKPGDLQSQGSATVPQPYDFAGKRYLPGANSHWKASYPHGMDRLAWANRIHVARNSINYRRFVDDFPYKAHTNFWNDTGTGNFTDDKVYVVQTNTKVVERCILLATDPGDLVLDPTCGSGTTAFVSERWGRRWITIDSSRVALAVARQRLTGALYPYFVLADSDAGRTLEAERADPEKSRTDTSGDIRQGFVYKRIRRITLRSIANNPDLHDGMSQGEIDAAIAAHADTELLYDQPHEDKSRVRVSGPFTVESLSPHRTRPAEAVARLGDASDDSNPDFVGTVIENLRESGIQNGMRAERLEFDLVEQHAGAHIQAVGSRDAPGPEGVSRAGICIGPQYGTVGAAFVKDAAREAAKDKSLDLLCILAFAFDPQVLNSDEEYMAASETFDVAGMRSLGRVPVLLVRMNSDLLMGQELAAKAGGNLFTTFGEPDIDIAVNDEDVTVELRGVDVYDPNTGIVRSDKTDKVALWMIDTDYDGESFFVRHCYFTGGQDPYKRLKTALNADINEEAWESLYSTISRPFPKPSTGRIAVKVINDYGDEVVKVYEVA